MPVRVKYDRRFLDASFDWFQDDELRALTMTPPVTREGQQAWFATLPKPGYILWGIEEVGEPIGAFGLKNVTDDEAEYWGYIGESKHWGKGIGPWMLREALNEANRLGLRSVYLNVIDHNERAIRIYEKMGFTEASRQGGVIRMEVSIS